MIKRVYLTAAGAAVACAFVVFAVFRAQKNENSEAINKARLAAGEKAAAVTSVVTAGRDIPGGTVISAEMLSSLEVDRNILLSLDAFESMTPVLGCIALKDISKGEVLTLSSIRDAGLSGSELSCLIPAGMRAIQIKAGPDSSVAGHIEAGDRVDVAFRASPGEDPEDIFLWEILARDLPVLRLGTRAWTGDGEYGYLVVAGEEETVLKILDAREAGEIKLILRPSGG